MEIIEGAVLIAVLIVGYLIWRSLWDEHKIDKEHIRKNGLNPWKPVVVLEKDAERFDKQGRLGLKYLLTLLAWGLRLAQNGSRWTYKGILCAWPFFLIGGVLAAFPSPWDKRIDKAWDTGLEMFNQWWNGTGCSFPTECAAHPLPSWCGSEAIPLEAMPAECKVPAGSN